MRRLFVSKLTCLLLISILILSIPASLLPWAFGAGDLTVNFIELGENGVLSPKFPIIRLSVKDSHGNFVSGVKITVTNPPYCLNTYPYYEWTVTERASDYVIKANCFPPYAIRDDFHFTFEKAGYNTKMLYRELATNAPCIEFIDENGVYRSDSDLQFNMEAVPSRSMISNQLRAVFVDSTKYYVTFAYQSEFVWEEGLSYIVLDTNYVLVSDEQTCNKAIFAYLLGPYFAQCFSTETLDQLSTWAQDMITYGGGAYLLVQIRNQGAHLAGWLIAKKLGSVSGELSQPVVLAQKILENVNKIRDRWLDFMTKDPPYFQMGVAVTEALLCINALNRLHMAGNTFLSLSDTVDSYRGTTRYGYSEINGIYEQWVNASHDMLVAIDILKSILPHSDLFSQLLDIAINMVSGSTGIPVDTLLATPKIADIVVNSLSKYAAMYDEFYEWIRQRERASTSLRRKIQDIGHTQLIVPVPRVNDFTISAYYVSTQTTSATIFAGLSVTFTVDVELVSGSVDTVSLSSSGHDETMSVSFSPQSATPPFTSSLSISTSSSTSGRFVLTVYGSAGELTRSCQVILEVLNPPPTGPAITIAPLDSPVMYGAYTRYHGTVDPYWNGWEVWIAQNVDGGATWYSVGQYIPTSDNKWYYPSSMTVVEIWLSAWLGVELPCTYLMKAGIHGTIHESNIISFTMIKAPTSAGISVTPDLIVEGETVTVTGTISSSLGISGSPYTCKGTWYIEWRQEGGSWNVLASGTVSAEYKIPPDGGPYSILFNIPVQTWTPPESGNFGFRARYSGDLNYEASTSEEKTITVESNTYPIAVSIHGLPSSNTTHIYIDDDPVGLLTGGASEIYEVSRETSHKISIDSTVSFGPDARYVSSTLWQMVSGPGQNNFTYHKEYKLTVEVLPAQSGSIDLTGSTWFDAGSIVEARTKPNASFTFNHWTLDDSYAGSSENLSLTMDTSHTLRAFFVVITNVTATVIVGDQPYASYVLVNITVWTNQDYINASIQADFLWNDTLIGQVSFSTDIYIGSNTFNLTWDSLDAPISVIGENVTVLVTIKSSDDLTLFSGEATFALTQPNKELLWQSLTELILAWPNAPPEEKDESWGKIVKIVMLYPTAP